jgi:hypothetical protein
MEVRNLASVVTASMNRYRSTYQGLASLPEPPFLASTGHLYKYATYRDSGIAIPRGVCPVLRRATDLVESHIGRDIMLSMRSSRLVLLAAFLVCTAHIPAQTDKKAAESRNSATTLTGILLAGDSRCDVRPSDDVHKGKWICPEGSSQWGLITPERQYSVRGNPSQLKQYERHRISVNGSVSPSTESFMDRFDVQSIASSEMPESQIRGLVEQLRYDQWAEPKNIANPTTWVFNFTPPMLQILQAGPAAQDVLLRYLDDPKIKDQVIILLGGLGDGKAVFPIIQAMADRNEARANGYARKVNLAANQPRAHKYYGRRCHLASRRRNYYGRMSGRSQVLLVYVVDTA